MATPMTASQFVAALKKEGVTVSERYSGWRNHERDDETGRTFGPVNGIVIHHTAGRDSLSLCYNGTSALPGPLCHTHLSKTGTATMISAGRANHAGSFATNAFNAMLNESKTHPRPDVSEPVDANDRTYGIEIENLGNGKDPYPAKQYDAAVRWAAAICRFHGWSANSIIGHKEGTRRKIDPSFSMNTFRADVAKRLGVKPKPAPARPWVWFENVRYGKVNNSNRIVQKALIKEVKTSITATGAFGKKTKEAYAAWQRELGYKGADADGIPGESSLKALAKKHGFDIRYKDA